MRNAVTLLPNAREGGSVVDVAFVAFWFGYFPCNKRLEDIREFIAH
jgi:hypothetical protein